MEEYAVVAALDEATCEICGALDGKVFKMSEFVPGATAPPFHPWCRCCTAPHFADMKDAGARFVRDPKTGKGYTVPRDMTYEEWKAQQSAKSDPDSKEFVAAGGKLEEKEFTIEKTVI